MTSVHKNQADTKINFMLPRYFDPFQASRCFCNKSHVTPANRSLNQEVEVWIYISSLLQRFALLTFEAAGKLILKVMKCGLIFSNRCGFALKMQEKCKLMSIRHYTSKASRFYHVITMQNRKQCCNVKVNKQVSVVTSPSAPQRALSSPRRLCDVTS